VPAGPTGSLAATGRSVLDILAPLSAPGRSIRAMLSAAALAIRPEFTVTAVTCRGDQPRWSPPEVRGDYRVVLVRRGRFRRSVSGRTAELDPTVGYVGLPHREERFAHPAGGDLCTAVRLTPTLWRTLTGDRPDPVAGTVYVDARLELAHRRLQAAASGGDVDFALAEQLLALVALALRRAAATPAPVDRPAGRTDQALVAAAREAIAADHPAARGLLPLAGLLGVSPYRLSRAFTGELGVSLTRYRNRVRVGRALQRLEDGQSNLAALAADLDFADQAHLCRTVRQHLERTPTALRRALAFSPTDPRQGRRTTR
jgi:AraC-like DNA-binding protein